MSNAKERIRQALENIAAAISVNDSDTMGTCKPHDHRIWLAQSPWQGSSEVTLGDLRAIAAWWKPGCTNSLSRETEKSGPTLGVNDLAAKLCDDKELRIWARAVEAPAYADSPERVKHYWKLLAAKAMNLPCDPRAALQDASVELSEGDDPNLCPCENELKRGVATMCFMCTGPSGAKDGTYPCPHCRTVPDVHLNEYPRTDNADEPWVKEYSISCACATGPCLSTGDHDSPMAAKREWNQIVANDETWKADQ